MTRGGNRALAFACIALAAGMVAWVRMLPTELHGVRPLEPGQSVEELRAAYRFSGDDGNEYIFLGGLDGYAWARAARSLVSRGSVCDEVVDGVCRDRSAPAPLGRTVRYPHSLHVRSIAFLHGVLEWLSPHRPLLFSAFLVPVLVALLSVAPAFAIGYRLAGHLGGSISALLSGVNPLLLYRTAGGDNDTWNVFFPLLLVWLSVEAILARSRAVGVGCVLVAGMLTGLYSTTWNGWPFAWAVTIAGLLANAAALSVAAWAGDREAAPGSATTGVLLVIVFVCVAGLATALAGASPSYLDAIPHLLGSRLLASPAEAAATAATTGLTWPDAYSTVSELRSINLDEVAGWMGGHRYLFVAWLGVILMLLPRRGWRSPHFATFLVGILCYRLLLVELPLPRIYAMVILAAPLIAALALYAVDTRDGPPRRASIALAVWFMAALFLGFGAVRYLLLLVVPLAVAVAVAADRLRGWVESAINRRYPAARRLATSAVTILLCLALYVPLQPGWAAARDYLPIMNDAWYETLTRIRDTSRADAIVSVWWDYGYIASYFSERSVTADGGTVSTTAPYWLGRSMMAANERESAGILRMLNCGPAPSPGSLFHEQKRWSFAGDGVRPYSAMRTIDQLVRLNEGAADELLKERGLPQNQISAVLAASHCRPPESYLLLTSRISQDLSWQKMAAWSFPRAFAAAAVADRPKAEIADELTALFELDAATSADIVDAARQAQRSGRLQEFPSTNGDLIPTRWAPCVGAGSSFDCAVRSRGIVGLDLRLDDPSASRLRGPVAWGRPAVVLIAGSREVEERAGGWSVGGWAVLFDPISKRAAVGSPAYLRSTYAQLALLDGRYSQVFERISDVTAVGERVTAWRVRWSELDAAAQ